MRRTIVLLSSLLVGACSASEFVGVSGGDTKKSNATEKKRADEPADVEQSSGGSLDVDDSSPKGNDDDANGTTGETGTETKPDDDPGLDEDGENSKLKFTIPKQLTFFFKKYRGSTNYYGKVQGDGKDAGAFYQVVCPGNGSPIEGAAIVRFRIKVGATWTEFSLGDTVPVDPKQPIYAKMTFDTNQSGVGHEFHHADDETVDIRSYFGPHPQYPDVSIAIATPGSGADWPVGIGRGHDSTRHPATPDLTYKTPLPNCD